MGDKIKIVDHADYEGWSDAKKWWWNHEPHCSKCHGLDRPSMICIPEQFDRYYFQRNDNG